MATLGTGTITVGGTTLEQDGELTEAGQQSDSVLTDINRDTQNTERELWDSRTQLSGEVTVDNEHIRNAAEAVGDAAQAVGSAVVDATQTAATAVASTAIAVGDKLFADRVYTYEELEAMDFGAPELNILADFAKKHSLTGRQVSTLQLINFLEKKYGTGSNNARINWTEVQRMAWDFENYGPEVALQIVNDGIFDPKMNDVGNIDELREDVRQYNARNTAFQETVGQAADIATGGGAVRMGIQTLEEISAAAVPIVRAGTRNTTEEAVSQSDDQLTRQTSNTNTSGNNGSFAAESDFGPLNQTSPNGSLSELDARKWYLEQESFIQNTLDPNASLEGQAKQAFELRNAARTKARDLMSNRELAESITRENPNLTWDQIVIKTQNKFIDRGQTDFTDADVFEEIIGSSQRSRPSVNEELGL